MTIVIRQSVTAVSPGAPASFLASGGTSPYVFSTASGGAGGSIDPSTGRYRAPANFNSDPLKNEDVIIVVDAAGETAQAKILVCSQLMLVCDIIAHELNIKRSRVYLYNQKIMEPTDFGLFIAVGVQSSKYFASVNKFNRTTNESEQFVSLRQILEINIISRGPEARDRKDEVVLALNSNYSKQQQATNSFLLAPLPGQVNNISGIDGAAIPYRFNFLVNMQYAYPKTREVQYYDQLNIPPDVEINS